MAMATMLVDPGWVVDRVSVCVWRAAAVHRSVWEEGA